MDVPDAELRKLFEDATVAARNPAAWRKHLKGPALSMSQVLAWADAHHARTGRWPTKKSGKLQEDPHESWARIAKAIRCGYRGFPGDSTLAQILFEARGVRRCRNRPQFTMRQIFKWANAHYVCHGTWPNSRSGAIPNSGGLTWQTVCVWLRYRTRLPKGRRRLDGLLAGRDVPSAALRPPDPTVAQILKWADAYFAAKGRWPSARSSGIRDAPGLSWRKIDAALRQGLRGLPGGKSLDQFLEARGRGNGNSELVGRSVYKNGRYVIERAKR